MLKASRPADVASERERELQEIREEEKKRGRARYANDYRHLEEKKKNSEGRAKQTKPPSRAEEERLKSSLYALAGMMDAIPKMRAPFAK